MTLNFGQGLFPTRKDIIKSYDFINTIQGQGIISYKLGTAYNSATTEEKVLSIQSFESVTKTHSASLTAINATYTKQIDHDYDIPVNTPTTLEGEASTDFSFKVDAINVGGATNITQTQAYFIIRIRKYNGTTETEIGSGKTETLDVTRNDAGGTTSEEARNSLTITCTRTYLAKGDILRVTIEGWMALPQLEDAVNDSGRIQYFTDPLDRLETSKNYNLPAAEDNVYEYKYLRSVIVNIPFKLDI